MDKTIPKSGGPVEGRGVPNPAFDEPVAVNNLKQIAECDQLAASGSGSVKSASGSTDSGPYGSQATVASLQSSTLGGLSGEGVELMKRRGEDISIATMFLLLTQVVVINFLITGFLLSIQVSD